MGGLVSIQGNLEVRGSGVTIDGGNKLSVSGYTDTEATSPTDYPSNVLFMNLKTGNFGVFSSTDVTFRNVDVGPSTQSTGCQRIENKIGYGGGITVVPRNILLDGMFIHDQNGDAGRIASDCHYGGLFLVTAENLTIRNCVFERNVVYHIQVQNFGGAPPAKNVLIEGNSFGCPVDWLYNGAGCDGQRAIQFDYDPGTEFTLRNNLCANGTGQGGASGLFGCYVGDCGGLEGLKLSGNQDFPESTTAPSLVNESILTVISETATTITLGWKPVPGIGYRFLRDGKVVSHTWDAARSTVKFSKGLGSYGVEPLLSGGAWMLDDPAQSS